MSMKNVHDNFTDVDLCGNKNSIIKFKNKLFQVVYTADGLKIKCWP